MFGKEGTFTQLGDLASTFTLDYFNKLQTGDLPWHKILLDGVGYDICAIHMKWNKTAVR